MSEGEAATSAQKPPLDGQMVGQWKLIVLLVSLALRICVLLLLSISREIGALVTPLGGADAYSCLLSVASPLLLA